ncbi:MAG: glycosyltransferase family 2 protein [Bacteroidetes bacterium]|nr:glycosyltransferase family 2 protein [Bacteroidota bacterium]
MNAVPGNFTDKITVGIPTFNRPDDLKQTLDCLLKQSYTNLEIIISDNCSSDSRVKEIMRTYAASDTRIVLYFQDKNIGIVKNFTFVLEKATGGFFMWKSDDDKIEDVDFISKLYTKLIETDSDFAFPDGFYLKNEANAGFALKKVYSNCRTKMDYLRGYTTSFSCLEFYGLYNLSKFDKKSEMKFNDQVVCPDILYLPELFLAHKVVFVPETHYTFGHKPSIDGFKINLNIFKDRQFVMRHLIGNFAATELLTPSERKEIVANLLQYYEAIINEQKSVSRFSRVKTEIKNKLKMLMGIGKT